MNSLHALAIVFAGCAGWFNGDHEKSLLAWGLCGLAMIAAEAVRLLVTKP